MRDEHRILVDGRDRLGNVAQIASLAAAGYNGGYSYECFAPSVHRDPALEADLAESLRFVQAGLSST